MLLVLCCRITRALSLLASLRRRIAARIAASEDLLATQRKNIETGKRDLEEVPLVEALPRYSEGETATPIADQREGPA
jgi:hypothetical protein